MANPTRFSSTLSNRSLVARLVAVLALAACGVAIYLLVTSFTESENGGDPKHDKKGRSEQAKDQKQASAAGSRSVLYAGRVTAGL